MPEFRSEAARVRIWSEPQGCLGRAVRKAGYHRKQNRGLARQRLIDAECRCSCALQGAVVRSLFC
jgi:hypothetical protein